MNKSINEILVFIYTNDFISEYNKLISDNYGKASLFYFYISQKFKEFIEIAKEVDEKELIEILYRFNGAINIGFKGNISKRRFINLLKKICNKLKTVLEECYAANQSKALIDLEELLGTKAIDTQNSTFGKYLDEQYINYCMTEISNKVLYRVRDCENDEPRDNCWHTPYNIRQYAYAGRFSTPGFPCLYLSDSPETSMEEIGKPSKEYRLIGTFTLKKGKILSCVDLRIPLRKEEIENMTGEEKINLFLSYPLRLLCVCPANEKRKRDAFAEEYLFSQVLINVIMSPNNENSGMLNVDGVCYNSTKRIGGINYALPAKTKSVPPEQDEKFSKQLEDLFDHPKPQEIKM